MREKSQDRFKEREALLQGIAVGHSQELICNLGTILIPLYEVVECIK